MMDNNSVIYATELWDSYDLIIAACGYEERCTNVAKKISDNARKKVCLRFSDRLLHNYEDNLAWFKDKGFEIYSFEEDYNSEFLNNQLLSLELDDSPDYIKVAVDYSSMNRKMLAKLIIDLSAQLVSLKIDVHFLYSPSKFSPPEEQEQFITVTGPVLPEFAGKLSDPNLPTVALAGIGYEFERTLGVLEYLEPAKVKVFIPKGCDSRFDDEVKSLNEDLFDYISDEDIIEYNLTDVFGLFKTLESLCYGLLAWSRPVMIPLGPKPFTLISLIVSVIFDYRPVVWRVTDDQNAPPSDRIATGEIIALGFRKSE
jgi:hypothetical protein